MYFLKIGEEELPTPSYYAVNADDIDSTDSRRSDETGQMHRRRLRAGVVTCNVKWILNGEQTAALQALLAEPELKVSLLDPASADYRECIMFASKLGSTFYQQQGGSVSASYWEIACTLTEY
ncbi:MAG: hypothetical protein NC084_13640 [Bacteroides sp.]|nr:hypothetical protein [Eubacterium sp.]MCM1419744.1 hypothetical protein [Roseburia sp.]MCM1463739.1 hypothetical protein [Bacteroides sp.]